VNDKNGNGNANRGYEDAFKVKEKKEDTFPSPAPKDAHVILKPTFGQN
jgi:hypothetical protein